VFDDRYHPVEIASPTQARNTIAYVLNNWRRHGKDQGSKWAVDYYSSGPAFTGWKELDVELPTGYQPLPVSRPRTWLLANGWTRAGSISLFEVPRK